MWKGDANLCHGFVPTFRGIPCYPDVSRNSNELASWKREGLRSSTLNWPRDVAIGELQELQEVQEVQEVKEVKENRNLHEELTKPVTFKTPRHFGSTGKSYSAAAWLFVSDHTDAIGCSRLLQSDTGSREKGKMCQPWRNKAKGAGHCCFCCSCSMSTCFSWLVPPLFSPSHKSLIFAIKSTLLNWWQLIATHQRPCQVKQSSS